MGKVTDLSRHVAHRVLGNRQWLRGQLIELNASVAPSKVLEIGSGKPADGAYVYSMVDTFPEAEFVMSDVNPDFGHKVVDVTDIPWTDEFDVVLCVSVLEHLLDPRAAASSIRACLRPDGIAAIAVPFVYPLHDEPADYWRFTEHGLREILGGFAQTEIRVRGPRKLPTGLLALAKR